MSRALEPNFNGLTTTEVANSLKFAGWKRWAAR